MKRYILLLSSVATIFLTGCVTGRRTFAVTVPTGPAAVATKGRIYISAVTDNRAFQNKPSDPSVPSIDGDVTTLTAVQKDRMIGRQRSGFGKAMGDIALSDDDTVTKRVRALVQEGLRRKGYEISSDPAEPTSLAIAVDEFWAWMTPGFFALTFEVKISTSLNLSGPRGKITMTVKSHGLNHGQFAKDGNWKEAFEPAFDDYLTNLGLELDKYSVHLAEAAPAPKPGSDLSTEIRKLDDLRKDNLITEDEFQTQKKKLLQGN